MKKRTKNTQERQISRRELLGGALAAAGVIAGAPAFLRGRDLNNKLNIAMIACGGRANANMNGDGGSRGRRTNALSGPPTGIPAENITVLCDVNQHAVVGPRAWTEGSPNGCPTDSRPQGFQGVWDIRYASPLSPGGQAIVSRQASPPMQRRRCWRSDFVLLYSCSRFAIRGDLLFPCCASSGACQGHQCRSQSKLGV